MSPWSKVSVEIPYQNKDVSFYSWFSSLGSCLLFCFVTIITDGWILLNAFYSSAEHINDIWYFSFNSMVGCISQIFKTYWWIQLTNILFRSVESVFTNWPVIFLSCTFLWIFNIKLCSGGMKGGMEKTFSLQQEAGKGETRNLVTTKSVKQQK